MSSNNSVTFYISERQRKILLCYTALAVIFAIGAIGTSIWMGRFKPAYTTDTYVLAADGHDSIAITVPDGSSVEVMVSSDGTYVNALLLTEQDFYDKYHGGTYMTNLCHVWTDGEDEESSDSLEGGDYVIDIWNDDDTTATVEIGYRIYGDRSGLATPALTVGVVALFTPVGLALVFGMCTAAKIR